jgi:hypothetical protein
MVLLYVPYAGACPAFYAEIFPTRVRYTALSIGYNIAVALFGGFATFLVRVTDNSHAPAAYVITAAINTLVVLLRARETAFAPLHLPARSSLARIQARRDCDARKHGKFPGMAGVYNETLMPRYIEMGRAVHPFRAGRGLFGGRCRPTDRIFEETRARLAQAHLARS